MIRRTRFIAVPLAMVLLVMTAAVSGAQLVEYGIQGFPAMAPAPGSNTVIVWKERTGRVAAQKFDSRGIPRWRPGGVTVCGPQANAHNPKVVVDSTGNAIVGWISSKSGSSVVHAQKLDPVGALQWAETGIALATVGNAYGDILIEPNGSGGAIAVWFDRRADDTTALLAQKVDSFGTSRWAPDGVQVMSATYSPVNPNTCPDGGGGIIVMWMDQRQPPGVRAQRVDASGFRRWGDEGIPVTSGYVRD